MYISRSLSGPEEVIFGMVVVDTLIEGVNPLGPADLNTLQEGDVIIAVDGKNSTAATTVNRDNMSDSSVPPCL